MPGFTFLAQRFHPLALTFLLMFTRGAHAAELQRTADAEDKRAARKARAASIPTSAPTHMCPKCGRAFRARIGLTSHLRTHRLSPSLISWSRGLHRPRRTNSSSSMFINPYLSLLTAASIEHLSCNRLRRCVFVVTYSHANGQQVALTESISN
jgi:hypothetical protein